MEFIVILLGIGLIVGLIIRNKDDNTMETLSKGCGCMFGIVLLLIILYAILYADSV